jgi:hypothetical protein
MHTKRDRLLVTAIYSLNIFSVQNVKEISASSENHHQAQVKMFRKEEVLYENIIIEKSVGTIQRFV